MVIGYDCIKGFYNKPIDLDTIMITSSWLLNQKAKEGIVK